MKFRWARLFAIYGVVIVALMLGQDYLFSGGSGGFSNSAMGKAGAAIVLFLALGLAFDIVSYLRRRRSRSASTAFRKHVADRQLFD